MIPSAAAIRHHHHHEQHKNTEPVRIRDDSIHKTFEIIMDKDAHNEDQINTIYSVYEIVSQEGGGESKVKTNYVAKVVCEKTQDRSDKFMMETINSECNVFACDHPNIIKYHYHFTVDIAHVFIMDRYRYDFWDYLIDKDEEIWLMHENRIISSMNHSPRDPSSPSHDDSQSESEKYETSENSCVSSGSSSATTPESEKCESSDSSISGDNTTSSESGRYTFESLLTDLQQDIDIINEKRTLYFDNELLLYYFRQFVEAVEYLHSHHIAHRDIKLENFLLDENKCRVVLTDFGFSHCWWQHSKKSKTDDNYDHSGVTTSNTGWYYNYLAPSSVSRESYQSSCLNRQNDTRCTPLYAPPELFTGISHPVTSHDVWGLGICLYVMCFGMFPYDDLRNGEIDVAELSMYVKNLDLRKQKSHLIERINKCIRVMLYGLLDNCFWNRISLRETLDWIVSARFINPFRS